MKNLTLHIDFETQSECDLGQCGVDVYARDPSTRALCMSWAFDEAAPALWVPGEPLVPEIRKHVLDGGTVIGHNVSFEWHIWNYFCVPKLGWPPLKIEQCDCTMARANAMGFPGGLDLAARACGIPAEKDMAGRRVMLVLSQPKRDGGFWTPETAPEKFQILYDYCMQDTIVEQALHKRLAPLSKRERKIWLMDQKINQRGVGIDLPLVRKCATMVSEEQDDMQAEFQMITANQVPSVNAHLSFKRWVLAQGVNDVDSIDKEAIAELLSRDSLPPHVRRAFEIRRDAAKSSTAKLTAMLFGTTRGRARYTFEHYGAKQTGRWAGRRLQLHNMPRPKIKFKDVEDALTRLDSREEIKMLYGNPMQIASDCLRSFLVPAKGNKFLTADFSNIEGRCLAWLANEEWKIKAFEEFDKGIGKDLYVLEYAKAFRVDASTVTDDQRQIGKVITLALGYAGGVGAFQNMAKAYGVKVPDAKANSLKDLWRAANPKIVEYWGDVQEAAASAIKFKTKLFVVGTGDAKVEFKTVGSFLGVKLPSSRTMYYPYPTLGQQVWVKLFNSQEPKKVTTKTFHGLNQTDAKEKARKFATDQKLEIKEISQASECIMYKSYDSVTKQWGYTATYGGSLVENLCQAVSRDILADAMLRLEDRGYPVVLHVHDEIVCEVKDDPKYTLKEYEKIMSETPGWAQGFPIVAKGWMGYRYRKA